MSVEGSYNGFSTTYLTAFHQRIRRMAMNLRSSALKIIRKLLARTLSFTIQNSLSIFPLMLHNLKSCCRITKEVNKQTLQLLTL